VELETDAGSRRKQGRRLKEKGQLGQPTFHGPSQGGANGVVTTVAHSLKLRFVVMMTPVRS
jgi:hypothetical protein